MLSAAPDGEPLQARDIVDDHELKHQGCATNDPHHRLGQAAQRRETAHGAEGDDEPQRDGADQSGGKKLQCFEKAAVQRLYDDAQRRVVEKHGIDLTL